MKRKGEDYAITPLLSVVTDALYSVDINDVDSPSSFTVPASKTWDATRNAMDQILERFDDNSINKEISIVKEVGETFEKNIRQRETNEIREGGKVIRDQFQNRIEECQHQLSQEEKNLRTQENQIRELEREVEKIRDHNQELVEDEKELRRKISLYKEQAAQGVEEIDEVELKRKEEAYRLQTQISLHATTTGIIWDYDDGLDSISGVIDIPGKQVQKKFSIERLDYSQYEIANQLWDMMEA